MTQRVHQAEDGELFLVGGRNEVARLYSAAGFAALVDLGAWRGRQAARNAHFRRLGLPWLTLLTPEKLSLRGAALLERLLGEVPVPPAARLLAGLGPAAAGFADPLAYLARQQQAGHPIFPATDSHWTPTGALCGFQWAMAAMGVELDYAAWHALAPAPLDYPGDLWEPHFAGPARERFDRLALPPTLRRVYANPVVRLKERRHREDDAGLHTGCHVAYRNEAAARDERLLLFGSSFSDHRAECTLLTFVAALFFREVHFVWSSELDLELIRRIDPARVLVEMPERFLTRCPSDRLDLAALERRLLAAAGADQASSSSSGWL